MTEMRVEEVWESYTGADYPRTRHNKMIVAP